MALRFKLPGEIPNLLPRKELKAVPALREPWVFKFTRGVDMSAKMKEIKNHNFVKVVAGVGAGKSSRMPGELARASGRPVLYVVPSPHLARSHYNYAKSGATGFSPGEVHWSPDDAQSVSPNGVTYMSGAMLVAMWLRGFAMESVPGLCVFLDEAHESDAYTYLVRHLALPKGASQLFLASATFDAGVAPRHEIVGKVAECFYGDADTPETWDPFDSGKPWGLAGVKNGLVFFVDSRSLARILEEKYRSAGLNVYRCTADSSVVDVERALADARDVYSSSLTLLILDSSFRVGFTFDADVAVDSGRVGYDVVEDGKYRKTFRSLYETEKTQTMYRFARGGGVANYYRREEQLPAVMCNLLGVEMEAVAYLMRIFGFAPVHDVRDAVYCARDLGRVKLSQALNSPYPLVHQLESAARSASPSKGLMTGEGYGSVSTGFDTRVGGEGVDGNDGASSDDPITRSEAKVRSAGCRTTSRSQGVPATVEENIRLAFVSMGMQADEVEQMNVDSCYMIAGCGRIPMVSSIFPAGVESVKKFAAQGNFHATVASLRRAEQQVALAATLARYNACVSELHGLSEALQPLVERAGLNRDSAAVRQWMVLQQDRVAALVLERDVVRDIAVVIATDRFSLESRPVVRDLSAEVKEQLEASFPKVNEDISTTVDRMAHGLEYFTGISNVNSVSPWSSVSQVKAPRVMNAAASAARLGLNFGGWSAGVGEVSRGRPREKYVENGGGRGPRHVVRRGSGASASGSSTVSLASSVGSLTFRQSKGGTIKSLRVG